MHDSLALLAQLMSISGLRLMLAIHRTCCVLAACWCKSCLKPWTAERLLALDRAALHLASFNRHVMQGSGSVLATQQLHRLRTGKAQALDKAVLNEPRTDRVDVIQVSAPDT